MSIAEGSVAVAATLMYCAPVFVYLVSFALNLEKATPLKWMAIAMVMVGIGLLAGLSYAVFSFGFKYAVPHGSPQAILVIAFAVLIAVLVWPGDVDQIIAAPNSPAWPLFTLEGGDAA